MESTPENIGVIALPHSTAIFIGDIPDASKLESMFRSYPNLIMHPNLNGIVHPSQFMLAHVDAVASVSSSVALQAMLWGTTIFALGDSHINAISDYEKLTALSDADLMTIDREKNIPFLAWMLSHYYIPAPYLNEPDWFLPYLTKCLDKWKSGVRDLDYFDSLDLPYSMAEIITSSAIHNVPVPTEKVDGS